MWKMGVSGGCGVEKRALRRRLTVPGRGRRSTPHLPFEVPSHRNPGRMYAYGPSLHEGTR